jgi:predicted amidohydrolase YtcJ
MRRWTNVARLDSAIALRQLLTVRGILAILMAMLFATLTRAEPAAVTVFEAKQIITMDRAVPTARFVAVSDGIILGVADSYEALSPWTRGRKVTRNEQFKSRILYPGFIDPHVHPMQSAVMFNIPFLAPDDWRLPGGNYPGARNPADYRRMLKAQIAASDAPLFISWGHHELFHGPIDRAELDQIASDRPVLIWQRSFHDIILNSKAMQLLGMATRAEFDAKLAAVKADPAHGYFDRGIVTETALLAALDGLRPHILTPDKMANGFADMQAMMRRNGVTTISDMGTGLFADFNTEAAMIKRFFERPDNPSRVMLMQMAGRFDPADEAAFASIKTRFAGAHVRVDRRAKLFADGAFFAQNMRMNAPGYADGHVGKWITEPADFTKQMAALWTAGYDLHVHVNGDEGLDRMLDAIAALDLRPAQSITLEHLGFSTEEQNKRIATMGLMVSAQPNYIHVLGDVYAKHGLGPDRAASMNRLGSLEAKGITLGLHSDFNMAPIEPLRLAWIAANRQTVDGNIKAPLERLSIEKAMRAITIEAAEVIGMQDMVGSIRAGKKADFAVLASDPAAGKREALKDARVEGVVFEGVWYPAGQ